MVDYKNSEQIYTAIKEYLTDVPLKQAIISTAKEDVLSIFGIDKMMAALNALYLGA